MGYSKKELNESVFDAAVILIDGGKKNKSEEEQSLYDSLVRNKEALGLSAKDLKGCLFVISPRVERGENGCGVRLTVDLYNTRAGLASSLQTPKEVKSWMVRLFDECYS